MSIAIIGGGIGGLSLALMLHARGLACEVFEQAGEIRELGVGITLLPHAMAELCALGLGPALEAIGIENQESVFYNRWGQFIYRESRGRHAGYSVPELGMHRGRLHRLLYDTARERLGAHRIHLGRRLSGIAQDAGSVTPLFEAPGGGESAAGPFALAVACDGVNSAVRRQFYPDEGLAFAGINTWRGVTVHEPILSGRSYLRVGSIDSGKMVIYPIMDDVDGQGRQLINWVAEIRRPGAERNDWNRPGTAEDFVHLFADWRFDWLDVPALIRNARQIFEYPMVDRDPVARWTFGRVTLLGDAAHPMYPRGSNGSAQALVDARELTRLIALHGAVPQALQAYEALRLPATARVVETNRTVPPDYINIKVDELSGGRPFKCIDELISQDELRRISEEYKRVAGFSLGQLKPA